MREENGLFLSARYHRLQRAVHSRWLHLPVGAIASVGLAYAAMKAVAWSDVADTFRHFPIAFALLSLVPLLGATLLRAARWHVLLQDERVRFGQVLLTQNTGIGLNNMLPVRMVSEPVQLALITRRYRVPFPTALATLVGGNVLDIFATAMLMGLGILLVPGLRDGRIGIHLFGAFVMFMVSALVFIAVAKGIGSIPIANRLDFFHRLVAAVGMLRDKPLRVWASFFATLAHWFLLGVAGWVLSTGLDIGVDPLTMATILVAATFFTSAVPSLPGGAGTYHFAIISMLTAMDIDAASAFSFAVVMHLLVVVPSSLIAVIMVWRVGAGAVMHRSDRPVEPRLRPAPSGAAPIDPPWSPVESTSRNS